MAKQNKRDSYRITLDFSPESRNYLEQLQQLTNCSTKAELFKQALNVLDFISNEISRGGRFVVENGDEKREVVFQLMVKKNHV